jgi:hypothetical protein
VSVLQNAIVSTRNDTGRVGAYAREIMYDFWTSKAQISFFRAINVCFLDLL